MNEKLNNLSLKFKKLVLTEFEKGMAGDQSGNKTGTVVNKEDNKKALAESDIKPRYRKRCRRRKWQKCEEPGQIQH